jgi:hypothetical protein
MKQAPAVAKQLAKAGGEPEAHELDDEGVRQVAKATGTAAREAR